MIESTVESNADPEGKGRIRVRDLPGWIAPATLRSPGFYAIPMPGDSVSLTMIAGTYHYIVRI